MPPSNKSRAGDCSGKSPNMHVAVAVRNMDLESSTCLGQPSCSRVASRKYDGHEWAERRISASCSVSRPPLRLDRGAVRKLWRGVALTWRLRGRVGLVFVDGQSMQHAGWQDCMRLARPRQVRHRVQWTWHRTLASLSVRTSRQLKRGGWKPLKRHTIYHPVSLCCFPSEPCSRR